MKLFFISILIVILITSITVDFFSLSNAVRLSYNFLPLSYSQQEQESKGNETITNGSNQNKASVAAINKIVQGTLVVTTNVNNEDGGSSKPSDFIIKVHGNNPSIGLFPGNSSATVVKLDMGMYSVTASGPSNYNSSYSMDCSGAVMSVETIKCEITNTYVKPIADIN
jgi:Prealbumin-like fold domain